MASLKNIDTAVPINANLDRVGYYKQHEPGDRPGDAPADKKVVAFNNLPFGSMHPGGANFSSADGSVSFVAEEIDPQTYVAQASKDGGEIVTQ